MNIVKKEELVIEKNKTCAFTGHRTVEKGFDKQRLTRIIERIVESGKDTFLVGMAIGFDTLCFHILEKLRERYKISIIACVPCENQSERFSLENKEEYLRMLNSADKVVILNKNYTSDCMMQRNMFMVDNAKGIVAYLRRNYGGTKNTIEYAKKVNVPIINV